MHTVSVNHKIKQQPDKVWQALDDFANVYTYNPNVEHSEALNSIQTGIGAERTCHFYDGNKIKERIISYEKGKKYDVEIYEPGKFPLKKAVATLSVDADGQNGSIVGFEMNFKPKFGPMGWLMAKTVMKKQFAGVLRNILIGLEKNLETGQIITNKNFKTVS